MPGGHQRPRRPDLAEVDQGLCPREFAPERPPDGELLRECRLAGSGRGRGAFAEGGRGLPGGRFIGLCGMGPCASNRTYGNLVLRRCVRGRFVAHGGELSNTRNRNHPRRPRTRIHAREHVESGLNWCVQ